MPFGLCNTPGHFHMVNGASVGPRPLLCVIYLDDLLASTAEYDRVLKNLQTIFMADLQSRPAPQAPELIPPAVDKSIDTCSCRWGFGIEDPVWEHCPMHQKGWPPKLDNHLSGLNEFPHLSNSCMGNERLWS